MVLKFLKGRFIFIFFSGSVIGNKILARVFYDDDLVFAMVTLKVGGIMGDEFFI